MAALRRDGIINIISTIYHNLIWIIVSVIKAFNFDSGLEVKNWCFLGSDLMWQYSPSFQANRSGSHDSDFVCAVTVLTL